MENTRYKSANLLYNIVLSVERLCALTYLVEESTVLMTVCTTVYNTEHVLSRCMYLVAKVR